MELPHFLLCSGLFSYNQGDVALVLVPGSTSRGVSLVILTSCCVCRVPNPMMLVLSCYVLLDSHAVDTHWAASVCIPARLSDNNENLCILVPCNQHVTVSGFQQCCPFSPSFQWFSDFPEL